MTLFVSEGKCEQNTRNSDLYLKFQEKSGVARVNSKK